MAVGTAVYTALQLPPGVFVDKQTSLLLAPALDDEAAAVGATKDSSNANDNADNDIVDFDHMNSQHIPPSRGAQNSNKLPRVQNDEECYVEEDMHSLLSSSYYNDDDNATLYDDESVFTTSTLSTVGTSSPTKIGGGSKKKKKLGKLQWRPPGMAKRRREKKPPTTPTPTTPNRRNVSSNRRSNVSSNDSVYGQQSVLTLKSAHTSFSTNTQKAGNSKINPRSPRSLFRGKKDQQGLPPQSPLPPGVVHCNSGEQLDDSIVTNASNNNNNNSNAKRSRRLRLLIQRQEEERLRLQEEEVRRQFDSHNASSSSSSSKSKKNYKINTALADDASVELVPSPTSVVAFDDVSYKMKRMELAPIGEDGPNNSTTNDDTNRNAGPIDIDTCSPHLPSQMTETERRNLAAMHTLGYTHLRNNEITNAITIFTEILRGQKERHGKHSLQAAMAMHNLGVVYVKSHKYYETSKLCEMASKIRREELGKNHLDVAVSLAQMGVALMELSKYEDALVVFREALRIRRLNLGQDCNHTLIVRILNNIGCALFELEKMEEARAAFEETLSMQRELMKEDGEKDNGGKEKKVNLAKGRSGGSGSEASSSGGTDKKKEHHMLLSIALTLCNLGSIHLRTGQLDASFVVFEEALLIQESVLGEKHKVVSNTRDSLNYVTKSIKNRDSPPPPPSKADAVEAKPESSKGQEQEQEKDSILFGLFDNYLTCNVNIAEEIEAWVEETKRFQDSVHCSEIS
mmetsp:Transcript_11605/g.23251  ORF Transcript_11605/g.23251 Transcript_11605/m.23251 type:complete len:741 (-) Transcript_11605:43-2265(-)